MAQLNRRDALTCSAVATAGLFAGSVPVATTLAATCEDAELVSLWEAWKAQWIRWGEAWKVRTTAEEKVWEDTAPRWEWVGGMGFFISPDAPYSATYRRYRDGEPEFQTIGLVGAKDVEDAYAMAKAREVEFIAEHERSKKAASRKHKFRAAERAETIAYNELEEITLKIKDAHAKGMIGVAVKLALCQRERDFIQEPARSVVASCYQEVSSLTGTDFEAEVMPW